MVFSLLNVGMTIEIMVTSPSVKIMDMMLYEEAGYQTGCISGFFTGTAADG